MKKYRIAGVDRESGLETRIVVEASSQEMASAKADNSGVSVVDVDEIDSKGRSVAAVRRQRAMLAKLMLWSFAIGIVLWGADTCVDALEDLGRTPTGERRDASGVNRNSNNATATQATNSDEPQEPTTRDLIHYSRPIVREVLINPNSARFPLPGPDYRVARVEGHSDRYQVSGWVESKNAFNAVVRMPYVTEFEVIGDKIHPKYLRYGGETVYDRR
ncbi:MAG: hypothetical protein ACF8PN_01635 [Phycisphaerales bacterium]